MSQMACNRLLDKIRRVLDGERTRQTLSYAECLGCLEIIKDELLREQRNENALEDMEKEDK